MRFVPGDLDEVVGFLLRAVCCFGLGKLDGQLIRLDLDALDVGGAEAQVLYREINAVFATANISSMAR